MMENFFHNQKY